MFSHLKENRWYMCVVHTLVHYTVVYCSILWYTVVCCGILWYTVVYCGMLWYTVVYWDILWYAVVYCSIPQMSMFANSALLGGGVRVRVWIREQRKIKRRSKGLLSL